MGLKSALLVTAGIAGMLGLGGQDPRFDYSFPAAELAAETKANPDSETALQQALEKTVSVRFRSASPSQVIDWMMENGISFITADDSLPKEKKITLNFVEKPMKDAMSAIGLALGGEFVETNSIYIFRPTASVFSVISDTATLAPFSSAPQSFSLARPAQPRNVRPLIIERAETARDLASPIPPVAPRSLETRALQLDQMIPPAEFQKLMEQSIKMADLHQKMSPAERAEFEKAMKLGMEQAEKALAQVRVEMKGQQSLTKEQRLEVEKALAEAQKEMKSARGDMAKEMAIARVEMKKAHDEHAKAMKESGVARQEAAKAMVLTTKAQFQVENLKKFMQTITPKQREIMKSRGYLSPKDLSVAQRKLINLEEKGKISLTFSANGDKIVIRN